MISDDLGFDLFCRHIIWKFITFEVFYCQFLHVFYAACMFYGTAFMYNHAILCIFSPILEVEQNKYYYYYIYYYYFHYYYYYYYYISVISLMYQLIS